MSSRSLAGSLTSPRSLSLLLGAVVLFLLARTVYFLAIAWPFDTDDAFITLRYARNLAEGHGLVWNAGEAPPVEGYSNFLFVILGALAIRVGSEPILWLKVLSSLALVGTCGVLYRLARGWVGPLGALVPAVLLTGYDGTILWTVSGLETAVFQFLFVLGLAAFLWGLSSGSPRWIALAGACGFVASITRPEGPLLGIVFVLVLVGVAIRRRSIRWLVQPVVILALTFALPYVLYFAWRASYFGRLLPNTVLCKAAFDGDPLALIAPFLRLAAPLLALALCFPFRAWDRRFAALLAVPALYVVILYGADPIVGQWNRHFLTAFALLTVAATSGAIALGTRLLRSPARSEGVVLAIAVLATTAALVNRHGFIVEGVAKPYAERMEIRSETGAWLEAHLRPEQTYLVGDAGMIPYRTHARVLDAYCLNNREMPDEPYRGQPGRYFRRALERRPEMIVVHSLASTELEPHGLYGFYNQLVKHPDFAANYRHVKTFGRKYGKFHYWIFERSDPGQTPVNASSTR